MSHKEYLKHVGMEIRIARIRQSLTQSQLGSKAGYKKTIISEVELGKRDSAILTYKRIIDALGMSMKEIL
jgi:transcriptional regulator with XRE-family HTH domain